MKTKLRSQCCCKRCVHCHAGTIFSEGKATGQKKRKRTQCVSSMTFFCPTNQNPMQPRRPTFGASLGFKKRSRNLEILGSHWYTRVLDWLLLRICMICILHADSNSSRMLVSLSWRRSQKTLRFSVLISLQVRQMLGSQATTVSSLVLGMAWLLGRVSPAFDTCIWAIPVNA